MIRNRFIWAWALAPLMIAACASTGDRDTIARLRHVEIEITEEQIDGGLEKAMQSYQQFLEETPDSALAPEAIRRLADLKIEKEYGTISGGAEPDGQAVKTRASQDAPDEAPPPAAASAPAAAKQAGAGEDRGHAAIHHTPGRVAPQEKKQPQKPPEKAAETEVEFENRTTESTAGAPTADRGEAVDDLERAGALEAIALYQRLLKKYPLYDRNDQVLYQMSRAYEELGRIEEAMSVMERLVREYPDSRYIDEVQFRRAEYFFTRKRYLDAEDAYSAIVDIGIASSYYELALYKLGWTFYKQELYEEALHRFVSLLDYKVSVGYDFAQIEDETERKRTDDTFRVISLSFSNIGGADSVVDYFSTNGQRTYEDRVYAHLGEFYFDKRRYADASATYNAFASRNPFHKMAPNFHMRVIEIHTAGGFPSLVLDAKKAFATTYGLKAEYWKYFDPGSRPEVLGFLKTNLTDLATHYHACYQDKRLGKDRAANFNEALHWYREFLKSFPTETESPAIHFRMAELLLENRSFAEAAVEYEKTAYAYPLHDKAAAAGYAAVVAYREHLAGAAAERKDTVKREVVRSSLQFAQTFPAHEKAAVVLGAAADDLYVMEDFDQALAAAGMLLERFPDADTDIVQSAWLVIGHSSFELQRYGEAETAYLKVLGVMPPEDKTRGDVVDNLAAAIYKQGEQANEAEDYQAAADHFLRVGRMAPGSRITANAEFDGATALIQLEDWARAAAVLTGFRSSFPGHALQPEVTKKIAFVYKESGQLALAAVEFERIETESNDDAVRQEALLIAAELYEEAGDTMSALGVYRRYVDYFPEPVEVHLETRDKIATILKSQDDRDAYLNELRTIVAIDAAAGAARTPRTRYLAGKAALVLAEDRYDAFAGVRLVKPFDVNLAKKQDYMKKAVQAFTRLMDYEIGEITAAATFYLAEIYARFSKALMTSERPDGLTPLELEQYELAIEEQAYPFEEKAIVVHENNIRLIYRGIYNDWIDKSLQKLSVLMPARYDKPEEESGIIESLEIFTFGITAGPAEAGEEAGDTTETSTAPAAEVQAAPESPVEAPPQAEQTTEPVIEPGAGDPPEEKHVDGTVEGTADGEPRGDYIQPAGPAPSDARKPAVAPAPAETAVTVPADAVQAAPESPVEAPPKAEQTTEPVIDPGAGDPPEEKHVDGTAEGTADGEPRGDDIQPAGPAPSDARKPAVAPAPAETGVTAPADAAHAAPESAVEAPPKVEAADTPVIVTPVEPESHKDSPSGGETEAGEKLIESQPPEALTAEPSQADAEKPPAPVEDAGEPHAAAEPDGAHDASAGAPRQSDAIETKDPAPGQPPEAGHVEAAEPSREEVLPADPADVAAPADSASTQMPAP